MGERRLSELVTSLNQDLFSHVATMRSLVESGGSVGDLTRVRQRIDAERLSIHRLASELQRAEDQCLLSRIEEGPWSWSWRERASLLGAIHEYNLWLADFASRAALFGKIHLLNQSADGTQPKRVAGSERGAPSRLVTTRPILRTGPPGRRITTETMCGGGLAA